MRHWLKKLFGHEGFQYCICWCVAQYTKLVFYTSRWTIEGEELASAMAEKRQTAIYVFWHGRLLMMPHFFPFPGKMDAIVSIHRDGELIAKLLHYFKFRTLRGSTSHQSSTVLRAVFKSISEKRYIAIAVDGPRGPRYHINSNVIAIAQKTNVPIIPVTYSVARKKFLSTWDQFLVPYLFSQATLIYGSPLMIPPHLQRSELETYKSLLETQLNDLTLKADQQVKQSIL